MGINSRKIKELRRYILALRKGDNKLRKADRRALRLAQKELRRYKKDSNEWRGALSDKELAQQKTLENYATKESTEAHFTTLETQIDTQFNTLENKIDERFILIQNKLEERQGQITRANIFAILSAFVMTVTVTIVVMNSIH